MRITIPNNYISERAYIIEVIFKDILGLHYELKIEEAAKDYVITTDAQKKLIIQDCFFNKYAKTTYLDKKNLPIQVSFMDIELRQKH